MPKWLTDLLNELPDRADVENRVRTTRDRERGALQEALRAECRLVLRTSEETEAGRPGGQVPIKLDAAHPAALDGVVFPDEIEVVLSLGRHRNDLEGTLKGVSGLLGLWRELSERADAERWTTASISEIQSTKSWVEILLGELNQHHPLKSVLCFREDVLGVYSYKQAVLFTEKAVNRASISLYWAVIGLVSQWMGCRVEDLTVVVLTHELAHAYSQLGADIDGHRWPVDVFATTEPEVKEGLAQYYTDRVLRRRRSRYPGAFDAYEQLLKYQPPPYHIHKKWTRDYSPEAVRYAMLEVRRRNDRTLRDFERSLSRAETQLGRQVAPSWSR